MSALHELLTRAEEAEIEKAIEVENLRRHKAMLKEAEDSAKRDLRSAHGIVVRLRGALDAISTSPDCERILALEEAAPVLVTVSEPPIAFTPALDYPDAHPVEPPKPAVADLEPAAQLAPPPLPSAPPVSATKLHVRIMDAFIAARSGNMASIEAEDLYRAAKSTAGQVQRAVKALEKDGRIKICKPSKQNASRSGCFTVLIKDAGEAA